MMELWNYLLYGHAAYVQKHFFPSYLPYMHIYLWKAIEILCECGFFMTFPDVLRTVLAVISSCCSCWMWTWAWSFLIFLGSILVFLDFDLLCATINIKSYFFGSETSPQGPVDLHSFAREVDCASSLGREESIHLLYTGFAWNTSSTNSACFIHRTTIAGCSHINGPLKKTEKHHQSPALL